MTAAAKHLARKDGFNAESEALAMEWRFGTASPEQVIAAARDRWEDRFALVSSFGTESAVLLHIAASVSKELPVLFLDTLKLFPETRAYRDALVDRLGLVDVRDISPAPADLDRDDPGGDLWRTNTNRCCFIRKVKPLNETLGDFRAWANGRKRYQGGRRSTLAHFEAADGRVKVNPLAHWRREDVQAYLDFHDLPRHPLEAQGFPSVGCTHCTDRVRNGEHSRAGRWRGQQKSECGIHLSYARNEELAGPGT
ncbi:phosphoadenylyl-sulfate reductase [Yunchengibacter salinarum]|uniref:phosphoadenylyl-sulfate reductase n=1 Tax=Yunchengibacter salinarum TaxID=3133399 RepID=UPI0035B63BDB